MSTPHTLGTLLSLSRARFRLRHVYAFVVVLVEKDGGRARSMFGLRS